jgi:hypothetical protein
MSLEALITIWPVALCLSSHLSTDDLVATARCSTGLRAALHGFGLPSEPSESSQNVRESIYVGLHGTPYWQGLKDVTAKTCSSKTHTKGDKVHNCRLCSALICEACIVRSSFARGKEETFKNRVRFFCHDCWIQDVPSKSERYPLNPPSSGYKADPSRSSEQNTSYSVCRCTLKSDGWLCIECKDRQNYEAVSSERLTCHGSACSKFVGPDYEGRRICIWCNLSLPRHVGHAARTAWTQKIIEARQRNALSRQADVFEYQVKRRKMMRMSRREMRGDVAVEGDADADSPQFIRHLDSCCNYRNHMREHAAPSGHDVYASKRGYWRYSTPFLVEIGKRCTRSKQQKQYRYLKGVTSQGSSVFARAIYERRREQEYCWEGTTDPDRNILVLRGERFVPPISRQRIAEWVALKTRILSLAFTDKLDFFQLQVTLQVEYDFDLTWAEFRSMLNIWSLTPLWEGTETEEKDLVSEADLRKLEEDGDGLRTHDQNIMEKFEARIDNHAASIIEKMVQQGVVLPLRTGVHVAPNTGNALPKNYSLGQPLTAAIIDDPLLSDSSTEDSDQDDPHVLQDWHSHHSKAQPVPEPPDLVVGDDKGIAQGQPRKSEMNERHNQPGNRSRHNSVGSMDSDSDSDLGGARLPEL